jgi:hypothetical protein
MRLIETPHTGVIAEILIAAYVNRLRSAVHHPDLVAEGEVDGGGPDLLSGERRDAHTPCIQLSEDRFSRQHGHCAMVP